MAAAYKHYLNPPHRLSGITSLSCKRTFASRQYGKRCCDPLVSKGLSTMVRYSLLARIVLIIAPHAIHAQEPQSQTSSSSSPTINAGTPFRASPGTSISRRRTSIASARRGCISRTPSARRRSVARAGRRSYPGVYAYRHGRRQQLHRVSRQSQAASRPPSLQLLGYLTAFIGKWHMGEDNDEHAPRLRTTGSPTKGGANTSITNSTSTANAKPGRATTPQHRHRHGHRLDSRAKGKSRSCLMLGHKAAAQASMCRKRKYAPARSTTSKSNIRSRRSSSNGKAGLDQGTPNDLARHLRPALRLSKEVPRHAATRRSADFANMVTGYMGTIQSVDDSVGRLLAGREEMGILERTR